MVFASIASLVILVAAGALLVAAAFHSEAIAGWENRVLISMAGGVARMRAALEEKQALAQAEALAQDIAVDGEPIDITLLRAAKEEQERASRMTA